MNRAARFCAGPMTRRAALKFGAIGLGGLGLGDIFRLQAEAAAAGENAPPNSSRLDNERSVIFLWLPGGPPHMEMYDLKPEAPSEYRGEFRPIHTNVPGMDICEHMPRQAAIADKFAILRGPRT